MSILEEAIVIADQYLTEEHAFNARMAYTRKHQSLDIMIRCSFLSHGAGRSL